MSKTFYITTTLPYVNASPHIGFAMEIIRADSIVRYKKSTGVEVFFNTGTDEHGQKLLNNAEKSGKTIKEYVDIYAEKFRDLKNLLSITDDIHFIRTTDPKHEMAAQEIWKRVKDNGYIYKKNYQAKYCVGCELEKTDSELVNGCCPIHPNLEIEIIEEENYFFAFSKVAPLLKELYEQKPALVIPDFRFNEAKAFLSRGLEDFSISRLKSKMSWGIPVPEDEDHVMYVWFDALTNYISTLGWPLDEEGLYKKFWVQGEKVQYCGKDNLRQQSMMWQAMLLAAGLPTTDKIIINGFITSGGQKMSKSLGNVISPDTIIDGYRESAGDLSKDVLRYSLLRHINSFEDSDVTLELIKENYNGNLANGIGNLVSRIMKMSQDNIETPVEFSLNESPEEYKKHFENFEINKACDFLWQEMGEMDKYIQDNKPFKVVKDNKEEGIKMIKELVSRLYRVASLLEPIMPETSKIIKGLVKNNKSPERPLFLRKE